jgi:hypothetical protein
MVRIFSLKLVLLHINSTNIPPIMTINRIYENQNLLSLWLVSFLVGLMTYQHPCTFLRSGDKENLRQHRNGCVWGVGEEGGAWGSARLITLKGLVDILEIWYELPVTINNPSTYLSNLQVPQEKYLGKSMRIYKLGNWQCDLIHSSEIVL